MAKMALSHSPSFLLPKSSASTISPSLNLRSAQSFLQITKVSSASTPILSNGYVASLPFKSPSPSPNRKNYIRRDSCLIIPPPKGTKPVAVVKFLGGAFVGATPEVTYSHLMELLAKEGFLVVSVPYNVTLNHEMAAKMVYENFHACYDGLLVTGVSEAGISPVDVSCLPVFSVGHSNGALLQLLVGSYFSEKLPKANAIVSFNNRPATEAIPNFEQFGPFLSQVMPIVETSPVYSIASNVTENAMKAFMDTAGAVIREYDSEALLSFNKFVGQLPSVFNQIREGTSEFKPTPPENRECFRNSYCVPNTLLVKFSTDAIDETDTIEEVLKPRVESFNGKLEKVVLSGNHLTPCIQDLKWQVGPQYTPADALAQSLKSISLMETRVLSRTIADWFKSLDFDS
ncbi:hypothetical protein LUZ60_002851 [Juncus effusus]|nr:hypothetical protein LUZ60_002851 [Juncus effusus]